jgi:hypothetical protein
MTAHIYGSHGGFDHYGKSVPIGSGGHSDDLNVLRAQIASALDKHRRTSTMSDAATRTYKNPVRQGYDMGLTKALDMINNIIDGDQA